MEEYSRNQEEFDAAFHAVIGSLKSEDLTLYWILYDNDNENARYKVSTYLLYVCDIVNPAIYFVFIYFVF